MKAEIKKLVEWSDAYYNNQPVVSDSQYDEYYEKVKELYPDDKFFLRVGTVIKKKSEAIKLEEPMGSLTKRNPSTALNDIEFNEEYLISPKFDGLSLKCIYKKGILKEATTRGDGFNGQPVLSRALHIMGIPKKISIKEDVNITGECICFKSIFNKDYKDTYACPRNFCVGTLRPIVRNEDFEKLIKTEKGLQKRLNSLHFIAYSANKDLGCQTKTQLMQILRQQGFTTLINPNMTLPYKEVIKGNKINEKYLKNCIDLVKSKLDVCCDGIVLEINNLKKYRSKGMESNGITPKGAIAVKHLAINQDKANTKVKDIEWNMSKRGHFIPTVIIDEVNLCDADINRITGNNFRFVKDLKCGIGSKIILVKSGDIIPRIIKVLKHKEVDYPKVCPYCGAKLKKGIHLTCINKQCKGRSIKKLQSFFETAKIDYVSHSTILDFIEAGFDTVEKVLNLTAKDIKLIDRYEDRKSKKIIQSINNMKNNITLSMLMHATGYFENEKTGLGTTKLEWFINELGVDFIVQGKELTSKKINKLGEVKGIGDVVLDLFIKGYPGFIKWFAQHKKYFNLKDLKAPIDGYLKGKVFCWTGFRNAQLKLFIEDNGGIIKDNITKDCCVLFAANESSKTERANKLGIKIVPAGKALEYIKSMS